MVTNGKTSEMGVSAMSEDGKNILDILQQLRRFCEQVSLLLRAADSLVAKKLESAL